MTHARLEPIRRPGVDYRRRALLVRGLRRTGALAAAGYLLVAAHTHGGLLQAGVSVAAGILATIAVAAPTRVAAGLWVAGLAVGYVSLAPAPTPLVVALGAAALALNYAGAATSETANH